MRCKNCGGILNHVLTDTDGQPVYRCQQGLSHLVISLKQGVSFRGYTEPCGLYYDHGGRPFVGYVAYVTGSRPDLAMFDPRNKLEVKTANLVPAAT